MRIVQLTLICLDCRIIMFIEVSPYPIKDIT